MAYYIARARTNVKNTLLIFIIIPFDNLIIRILLWPLFLAYNGVFDDILSHRGSSPNRWDQAYRSGGDLVMVYGFALHDLPLYSVWNAGFTLLNAAMDRGK